jgi:hypothetical protein
MHLKVLTVFAIICSSALADQFGKYQTEFGKQYTSPKEYVQRKAIFEANLKEIEKHNENRANTYTRGVNQFTDMTQNEFDALIQGRLIGCLSDNRDKKISEVTFFSQEPYLLRNMSQLFHTKMQFFLNISRNPI